MSTSSVTSVPTQMGNFASSDSKVAAIIPFASHTSTPSSLNPWTRFISFWSKKQTEIQEIIAGIKKEGDAASKKALFIKALQSKHFHAIRLELRTIFEGFSIKEQDVYLKSIATLSFETGEKDLVNRCLNLLTLEKMKELVKEAHHCTLDIYKLAEIESERARLKAKHIPEKSTQAAVQSELRKGINHLKTFTFTVLNNLLAATQFFELGHEPESAWDASFQLQIYYNVLTIPLTIATFIYGYLQNPVATTLASATAVCGLLSGLYTYLKWIQPAPVVLPYNACNLTLQERNSPQGPTVARAEELDLLIQQLSGNTSKEARQHPLLCGRPGVGKSEILKGLAHRIVQGDVPDALKGKELFVFNTASLCDTWDRYRNLGALGEVLKKIGRHRDKVIIAFDEIHAAKQDDKLWTRLLSVLDTSQDSLPFCIGITSQDKLQEIEDVPALSRRFKKITVEETSKEKTIEILKAALGREMPDIEIEDGVLEKIIEVTDEIEKQTQPAKAKNALALLTGQLRSLMEGSEINKRLKEKKAELYKTESETLKLPEDTSATSFEKVTSKLNKIKEIKFEIAGIEQELKDHTQAIQAFKKFKERCRSYHHEKVALARDLVSQKESSSGNSDDERIKLLFFKIFYLDPAMKDHLQDHIKSRPSLNLKLTQELVKIHLPKTKGKQREED